MYSVVETPTEKQAGADQATGTTPTQLPGDKSGGIMLLGESFPNILGNRFH